MRLGEMLIERRLIEPEDLDRALEIQKERSEKIGKILVDLGFIAMHDVLATLSDQLAIPLVTIEAAPPSDPTLDGLAPRFLRQSRCLPVELKDSTLTLAMADPLDFETISAVRGFTGLKVEPVLASEQEILDAVDKYYGESEKQEQEIEGDAAAASEDLEHLRDMASTRTLGLQWTPCFGEACPSAPATFTSSLNAIRAFLECASTASSTT